MTVGERMAKIEEKIEMHCEENKREFSDIKDGIKTINEKLDTALSKKADKEEVKDLRDKSWQIIAGVFLAMITALIGLIISIAR